MNNTKSYNYELLIIKNIKTIKEEINYSKNSKTKKEYIIFLKNKINILKHNLTIIKIINKDKDSLSNRIINILEKFYYVINLLKNVENRYKDYLDKFIYKSKNLYFNIQIKTKMNLDYNNLILNN